MTKRNATVPLTPIVIAFFSIAAFLGVMYVALPATTSRLATNVSSLPSNNARCTADAKQCPDGTFVGRTGPKCSFAPCSTINVNTAVDAQADWRIFADPALGFSIRTPLDWEVDTTRSTANEVVFLPNAGTESREAIKSTVTPQSLVAWQKTIDQNNIAKVSSTSVGGQPAVWVQTNAFALNYIAFRHSDRLFVVTSNTKMIDLGILDTFTFLP